MERTQLEGAALRERLLDIVAEEGLVDRARLVDDAELDALGIKSADVVLVLMAIESEFGVYLSVGSELSEARTIGAMLDAVIGQIRAHDQRPAP